MRPNLNKNLILPWTPQGEKASGNHQILGPRKKATTLKVISLSGLSSRVSCINSLTSPTVLLWPIPDHRHKYLYKLASTYEQKPIVKKKTTIYERNAHEAKMAGSKNSFQALHLPRKMYAFLVPPCQETFLKTTEHSWTKKILSRGCRGIWNE